MARAGRDLSIRGRRCRKASAPFGPAVSGLPENPGRVRRQACHGGICAAVPPVAVETVMNKPYTRYAPGRTEHSFAAAFLPKIARFCVANARKVSDFAVLFTLNRTPLPKNSAARPSFPFALVLWCAVLAACGSVPKTATAHKTVRPAAQQAAIQIRHVSREAGAQELLLRSMVLVGTPYRYGGSSRGEGFDCSGMVQFLYRDALNVALPRTARDMAAASRRIRPQDLKVGDVVFFNTGGHPYSHMGLYIGNGEFIHAPSGNGTIRTARLDQPYFSRRFTGAHTFFAP